MEGGAPRVGVEGARTALHAHASRQVCTVLTHVHMSAGKSECYIVTRGDEARSERRRMQKPSLVEKVVQTVRKEAG